MRKQNEFSWLQFFASGIVAAVVSIVLSALLLYFGYLAAHYEFSDYLRVITSWSLIVAAPFGGAIGFFRWGVAPTAQQFRQKTTIIAAVASAIWGAGFAIAWMIAFSKGLDLFRPILWGAMCVVVGYFSAKSDAKQ